MKSAPKGFSEQSWQQFLKDGILVIEDALSTSQVERFRTLIATYQNPENPSVMNQMNIVEHHPVFTDLIDLPAHL